MTVRCKFTCYEVGQSKGWNEVPVLYKARFAAVATGSEENKAFFAATPSGTLELGTVREGHFEVGKDYYLDITPA